MPPSSPVSESKLMTSSSGMSLSVNYLPTKFSNSMLNQGTARRRARKKGLADGEGLHGSLKVAKIGGGVDAFRSGEARMPIEGDDDYDGVNLANGAWSKSMKYMKWTKFKWILFFANLIVSFYLLIYSTWY